MAGEFTEFPIPYVSWSEANIPDIGTGGSGGPPTPFWFPCGDRLAPITAATDNIQDWMVPQTMSVSLVLASLTIPATTGTFTVRLKRNGTTIFSTNLTFDAGEKVTTTATSSAALSDVDWTQGDIITTDVVNAADGTASGLKIYIIPSVAAADSESPSAPSGLTADAISSTAIDLDWVAASDDTGVTGYRIQRATNAGFTTGVVNTNVGNVVAASVTGLTASTTYYFRVLAKDAAGNQSDWSNTANDTTTTPSPLTDYNWLGYWNAKVITGTANGDPLSTWVNEGTGPDLVDPGSTPPTYIASNAELGSNPAVLFDASGEGLKATAIGATGQCTVFIYFAKASGPSNSNTVWAGDQAGPFNHLSWNVSDNEMQFKLENAVRADAPNDFGPPQLWRVEFRASATKVFKNGVDITDDDTSTSKPGTDIFLGNWVGTQMGSETAMPVGFFAISDGLITGTDAEDVEDYITAEFA